ncbi:disease resistance protein RPS6-like [Ziziphus jujuba]|uniref:Disease resistance protein RPS6-like n=1 Tax=Ziziphus jujuba TaxID=326968 RepID=A0ABM3ZUK6_ZIZJJ|nr:disease resistance protein RPS6-like [Ziziphus jujuba]
MDHRLERVEEISLALHRAIQVSKVSVIIFSENYASSTSCLNEFVQTIKCKRRNGQFVIPVFYCIDPSYVRKQQGTYAVAFAMLEQHFRDRIHKVQEWRAALTEATNLSGFDSWVIRPESKLVEAIVEDVLRKLNHISTSDLKGLVDGLRKLSRYYALVYLLFACSAAQKVIIALDDVNTAFQLE